MAEACCGPQPFCDFEPGDRDENSHATVPRLTLGLKNAFIQSFELC